MDKIVPLSDAVAELIQDGQQVAREGFTHLIPFAAGHEIIRQRKKNLTLIRKNSAMQGWCRPTVPSKIPQSDRGAGMTAAYSACGTANSFSS